MAPHSGIPWYHVQPTNPAHNLLSIRDTDAPLSSSSAESSEDDDAEVDADVQQDTDAPSDSSSEEDTRQPRVLSNKPAHILAYGWDADMFSPEDVVRHILSLQLPIMDELEPKQSNHVHMVDINLAHMDEVTWRLLKVRAGYIGPMLIAFRVAVGDQAIAGKHHAWGSLSVLARTTLRPVDFPYDVERRILDITGVDIIIHPQTLRNNWYAATTSTGNFDIAVSSHKDWEPLQKQHLLHVQEITGRGRVLQSAAAHGKLFIAVGLGEHKLDIINLPGRANPGTITRLFTKHDITYEGIQRRSSGYRCTLTVGFPTDDLLTAAALLLSG
jgi:hypothetical protein